VIRRTLIGVGAAALLLTASMADAGAPDGTVLDRTATVRKIQDGAPGVRATAAGPTVRQMVVFRSGEAVTKRVAARRVTVRVQGRRCAAGDGTPLAALVRSRPGRIRLRDFGSCSRRPRDGAGLFVSAIGPDRNRGQNGWVYKVGRRSATAGAADPSGPFGRGRLRSGQRVTWFYCRLVGGGCQRTLEVRATAEPGGLVATVRGYDDEGRGIAVEGAIVSAGRASALTGPDGSARLAVPSGAHRVVASKTGLVRSFAERVEVP
jgi:hypothetical protein